MVARVTHNPSAVQVQDLATELAVALVERSSTRRHRPTLQHGKKDLTKDLAAAAIQGAAPMVMHEMQHLQGQHQQRGGIHTYAPSNSQPRIGTIPQNSENINRTLFTPTQ